MIRTLIIVCCSVLLFSCQRNPFDIELREKNIDFQFIRLDQEMFRSEIDNPIDRHKHLIDTYPQFYRDYFERILRVGSVEDTAAVLNFSQIVKAEPIFEDSQFQIDSVFFLDQELRADFLDALKYYAHYFPSDTLPNIVAMNSVFNYAVFPSPKNLGIGLEFYLGQNHFITKELPTEQFPQYQKQKMSRDYLVSDALRGYLLSTKQAHLQGKKLMNHLIYQGKVMYALNAILPFEKEYLQFGYLENEKQWCEKNEFNIWKSIVDEDILFSSEMKQVQRFTGYGPFTQGFPEDSPGMISLFIGKQIVLDYMKKHPECSMEKLFKTKDEEILNAYRPRK